MTAKFLILLILLFTCTSQASEITGHYCYTYGDKESMQEARTLTRTLAIRNAVGPTRHLLSHPHS